LLWFFLVYQDFFLPPNCPERSQGPLKNEIANYVFCLHTKTNITNYKKQQCIGIFFVPVRPYALKFFRCIIVFRFLIVLRCYHCRNCSKGIVRNPRKYESTSVFKFFLKMFNTYLIRQLFVRRIKISSPV
jgi:hypothetical protein